MKAGDRRDDEGSGDPWSQPGMAAWALCWEQCSLVGSSIWHRGLSEAMSPGAGLICLWGRQEVPPPPWPLA